MAQSPLPYYLSIYKESSAVILKFFFAIPVSMSFTTLVFTVDIMKANPRKHLNMHHFFKCTNNTIKRISNIT